MGLRITTWNVNGIRNPFGYQPWRDQRTFAAMFDILEADIVVMQETKIQRKDLQDDMVLVPGWDVFFSLPKHKKGYSGVVIYTRSTVCAPIRAEEGITGILCPPNSSTSFCNLPEDQQIGGYPSFDQLDNGPLDASTLDSEGRCVVLEFPAFVLIGVYCPANRDETRDDFRLGFLNALDARIRNLVTAGKRVFLTGDLNIIGSELDTAKAEEQLHKQGLTSEEFISTPARRIFNQLVLGGQVLGERDDGRENPVLWDICRSFHPGRKGMFTCWEQKINARPANFGSRIDYVLCSKDWKEWFYESDIQEGLMGSDHCPVYAIIKDKVEVYGTAVNIKDIMNPGGMFIEGVRQREWSKKDMLPTSAKLIPEFDNRRSIKDMFTKKPSLLVNESSGEKIFGAIDNKAGIENTKVSISMPLAVPLEECFPAGSQNELIPVNPSPTSFTSGALPKGANTADVLKPSNKRSSEPSITPRSLKRGKSGVVKSTAAKVQTGKGQSSLTGFFKPKLFGESSTGVAMQTLSNIGESSLQNSTAILTPDPASPINPRADHTRADLQSTHNDESNAPPTVPFNLDDQADIVDPIVSKESWSRLLGKRDVPRCEHDEPCVSYKTKKPGVNCGRSFYICPRPVGPSGAKEKNTEWRCGTFIWSSDWTRDGA